MGHESIADTTTMVAQNILVGTEIVLLFFIIYWLNNKATNGNKLVLYAWLLVGVGYMLRIGFWSVALFVHDFEANHMRCTMDMLVCVEKADPYPQFATQWRWVQIIPAFMVLTGNLLFISFIQGMSFWKRYLIGTVVVLISILVALHH